jgi:hypothetical protein
MYGLLFDPFLKWIKYKKKICFVESVYLNARAIQSTSVISSLTSETAHMLHSYSASLAIPGLNKTVSLWDILDRLN